MKNMQNILKNTQNKQVAMQRFFVASPALIEKMRQEKIILDKEQSYNPQVNKEGLLYIYLLRKSYALPYYPRTLLIEEIINFLKTRQIYQASKVAYQIEILLHFETKSPLKILKSWDILLENAIEIGAINEKILARMIHIFDAILHVQKQGEQDSQGAWEEILEDIFKGTPVIMPRKELQDISYLQAQRNLLMELQISNFLKKEGIELFTPIADNEQKQILYCYEVISLPIVFHDKVCRTGIIGEGASYAINRLTKKNGKSIFREQTQENFEIFKYLYYRYPLFAQKCESIVNALRQGLQESQNGEKKFKLRRFLYKLSKENNLINGSALKRYFRNNAGQEQLIKMLRKLNEEDFRQFA